VALLCRTRLIVLTIALAAAGCASPLGPERGYDVPKDPGTVVAHVTDQAGAPLRDVKVQVHDLPNPDGPVYSVGQWTNTNGVTSIDSIPAGHRRVEVTPPAGCEGGPDGLVKWVDVVKDASVVVAFSLVRK
jgi:hypothetical protein